MTDRKEFITRIETANKLLGQDIDTGKCARLVTAAFLGIMLPASKLHLEYLRDEEEAGLRTMHTSSVTAPIGLRLLNQRDIEVDGIIFDTETLDSRIVHRTAVLFDTESRKNGSIVYVDALANSRRYEIHPTIDSAFDYMSSKYNLPAAWSHVVIPRDFHLPNPDTTYGMPPMGEWIVNGVKLRSKID